MQMHNHTIPLKSALKEIFKILWINIGFHTISCAQFIRTTFGSTYIKYNVYKNMDLHLCIMYVLYDMTQK